MTDFKEYRRIYSLVLDAICDGRGTRDAIIEFCLNREGGDSPSGEGRGRIGAIINEMHAKGVIAKGRDGEYYLKAEKPVAIRVEACEEELLALFKDGAQLSRQEIKARLVAVFQTDRTATERDDSQLFTYVGKILKHLTLENYLACENGLYYAIPESRARIESRREVLSLRARFLKRLHRMGGEFFESFFINLLTKYFKLHDKTVLEAYVTGGSLDGGIDGVCVTRDGLGFQETVMVQTKNRTVAASETDVRGFYGAVCAKRGTRGIFATTGELHEAAWEFLSGVSDCVGVDGARVFELALETGYGIKKENGDLYIDEEIFS